MARRRANNYTDSKRYHHWLERAEEDMIAAEHLRLDEDCYNNAAFHCQQAIEKALKSYILLKSNELVDGHNLTWLCKRAMKYDRKFNQWLDESAALNHCYIETRYPADIPLDITREQIDSYYKMSEQMYEFILLEVESINENNAAHPHQRQLEAGHNTRLGLC